jgi:hypothetical protein
LHHKIITKKHYYITRAAKQRESAFEARACGKGTAQGRRSTEIFEIEQGGGQGAE